MSNKRGPKSILEDKEAIAELLINGDVNSLSLYHKHKLEQAGYLSFRNVASGHKGRPKVEAVLNEQLQKGFRKVLDKFEEKLNNNGSQTSNA